MLREFVRAAPTKLLGRGEHAREMYNRVRNLLADCFGHLHQARTQPELGGLVFVNSRAFACDFAGHWMGPVKLGALRDLAAPIKGQYHLIDRCS